VLALYDIDEIRRHQSQAQDAREYAEAVFNTVREPLVVLDGELRIQRTNPAFTVMFQISKGDVEGRRLYELAGGSWSLPRLKTLLEEVLPHDRHFEDVEIQHDFPGIGKSGSASAAVASWALIIDPR